MYSVFAKAESPYEQDCAGSSGFLSGDSITLNIDTAFDGQKSFRLSKVVWNVEDGNNQPKEEIEYSLILKKTKTTFSDDRLKSTRTISCEKLKILKPEYEKLLKLYKDALKINFFDDVQGLDGSIWCIEIENVAGFQQRRFCFWSPDYESKKRNLEALSNLGKYLFQFTESQK